MEKFYIVTNEDFLNEIKDYNVHDEERRKLINEFLTKKELQDMHIISAEMDFAIDHLKISKNTISVFTLRIVKKIMQSSVRNY